MVCEQGFDKLSPNGVRQREVGMSAREGSEGRWRAGGFDKLSPNGVGQTERDGRPERIGQPERDGSA